MFARHLRRFALLAASFLATLLNAQQTAPNGAEPSPPIRISVNRVNVGVSVTDASGKFADGLGCQDFHIFDNGIEQPITDFLAIEAPAQTLMLVEAGPAVYLLEGGHLQAARAFLAGLAPDDRVALVKYAEAPQGLVDFTTDKQSVAGAFDELSFNLGFGSLNLSTSLSKVLDWLAPVSGKKTIVLLATGVDTSSTLQIQDLLRRLKTSDVRVMTVSLIGNLRNLDTAGKKKSRPAKVALTAEEFAEADSLLRQIADSTGGQAFFPSKSAELPAVFARIAQVVRHEFSLAFAPPAQDGAIHSLEVRVTPHNGGNGPLPPESASAPGGRASPNYRVDYRRAYLAPPPSNP